LRCFRVQTGIILKKYILCSLPIFIAYMYLLYYAECLVHVVLTISLLICHSATQYLSLYISMDVYCTAIYMYIYEH
jgi:hypothetical protein